MAPSSPSWRRNPAGSNQSSAIVAASRSSSQPPCSGCQWKARLFTRRKPSTSPGWSGRIGRTRISRVPRRTSSSSGSGRRIWCSRRTRRKPCRAISSSVVGECGEIQRRAATPAEGTRGRTTVRPMAPSTPPPATERPATRRRPRSPKGRARLVHERLAAEYPDAVCELDHRNAYELLAATILSAQSTDARVNMVTPALFERYPTPEDLAEADPEELEELIRSTGFFRSTAKSLIGMARGLVERHGGEVPGSMRDLVALPGVGRKTANVVRSVALGLPGLPVDTHVLRLSKRLGLTTQTDPVKVEMELNPMVPAAERGDFSLRLILHGRRVCFARKPRCEECVLADFCPSSRA